MHKSYQIKPMTTRMKLDITIPSPSLGQELGEGDTSIIAGDIIEEDQGNNGIPFELPFP